MISFIKNCAIAVLGRSWRINRPLKPVVLHLTLTDRCNLKCRMCNIWRKKDKRDVPLDIVREIASSKYGRHVRILDITGGEPFLAGIGEVVDILDQNRLRLVLISTNGVKTKKTLETVRCLLDDGDFSLHLSISLDGMRDYHDSVRDVEGTFDKLKATILELKKLRSRRLRVGIKMTLMPENIHAIIPVYDFAMRHGLDFTAKPAAAFEFLNNPDMDFSFSQDQTKALNEALHHVVMSEKNRALKGVPFWERIYHASNIVFHESLIAYMSNRLVKGPHNPPAPCLSTFLSIMVHSDGKAYDCPTMMTEIGDIEKDGFDSVWKSSRMRSIRKFIRKGHCACFSQCDQMPSLIMKHKLRFMWRVLCSYLPRKPRRETCPVYEN